MLNKIGLLLVIALSISGCKSTPEGSTLPKPSVTINMDVENGSYESLSIDYWKPEYDLCFDVNVLEIYSKQNWGAQIAWLLSDNKGNTFKIYFASVNDNEFNLLSEYLDKEFEVSNRTILYKGISIKEVHSSKFSFSSGHDLNLNFKNKKTEIRLPFSPKKFVINASGVKAKVGYSSVKCNIS